MANCNSKWQGELRRELEREAFNEKYRGEILTNPNLLEKESPYIIKCDCCKKTFSSLTPDKKLCNYCQIMWMGNWHIYKVLNSNEKIIFATRGSFSFDSADAYRAFKQKIKSRVK